MGVESNTGALQAAGSGCWRWFGNIRLSLYSWTMTAVSFDGTDELHWINGIQMESDACPGAIAVTNAPLSIGSRPAGNSQDAAGTGDPPWSQFQGDIDEVMLFSAALSTREVSDLFLLTYRAATPLPVHGVADLDALKTATGANGRGKTLIGFWPLDGDGDDLTDASTSATFGQDMGGNNLGLTATNAEYVTGVYGQAFRVGGGSLLETISTNALFDADYVTMISWVKPLRYEWGGVAAGSEKGIIMNKENSYEMGLSALDGNLQAAFSPCWRWYAS